MSFLVLSGGGAKGAYEAGAIYNLAHMLDPSEVGWDVMTGVSAGSINVAGMMQFPVGKEKDMADWLVNRWSKLTSAQVYKDWNGGVVDGIFLQKGVYDNSPLVDYITGVFAEFPKGV